MTKGQKTFISLLSHLIYNGALVTLILCAFSFAQWNGDFSEWTVETRTSAAFVALFAMLLGHLPNLNGNGPTAALRDAICEGIEGGRHDD